MKIIAGKYKNRNIITSINADYRPTMGKTREALFSILTSGQFVNQDNISVLSKAIVLDLFCGSGSFGFEALSRGADLAVFVDNNPNQLTCIEQTANSLGLTNKQDFMTIRCDIKTLPKARLISNIIFVDPPYELKNLSYIIDNVIDQGWLAKEGILIIELSKKDDFKLTDRFILLDHRSYGKSKIIIIKLAR